MVMGLFCAIITGIRNRRFLRKMVLRSCGGVSKALLLSQISSSKTRDVRVSKFLACVAGGISRASAFGLAANSRTQMAKRILYDSRLCLRLLVLRIRTCATPDTKNH